MTNRLIKPYVIQTYCREPLDLTEELQERVRKEYHEKLIHKGYLPVKVSQTLFHDMECYDGSILKTTTYALYLGKRIVRDWELCQHLIEISKDTAVRIQL